MSICCLPPFKKERRPALLVPRCLQVGHDSLSCRLDQSAAVQVSPPSSFCPLALAVCSDHHSRVGSWKKLLSLGILQHDTGILSFICLVADFCFLHVYLCAETLKPVRQDFFFFHCLYASCLYWSEGNSSSILPVVCSHF